MRKILFRKRVPFTSRYLSIYKDVPGIELIPATQQEVGKHMSALLLPHLRESKRIVEIREEFTV